MPNLNRVVLMGHLGRDPETQFTQGGKQWSTFSLCTNHNYKVGDKWESKPEWHRIVAWGKQSEIAAEQFRKGDGVYVEGRLSTREWEDREGNKRSTTEIVAYTCCKLVLAPVGGPKQHEARQERAYSPPPPEDDIPF